jgi:predicted MFS family arabinose efflux permease
LTVNEVPESEQDISFARLIGTGIGGKLLVDTGTQIFNPFLQIIAVGLGTNVVVLGRMLGLRSAMGLFAPIFGALADRHSYRRVLQLGLMLNAVGLFLIGASSGTTLALIGMIFAGLGMSMFVPTLHAYLSHRLPYNIRARGLGMVEYSWALTGIFGLFLMGLVIEFAGWRWPFFILAVGLVIATIVFGRLPPARTEEDRDEDAAKPPIRITWRKALEFMDLGPNRRSAYANIVAGAFIYFSAMQIMIMYGAWLGSEYGLNAAQLGTIALAFGLFDLTASVSVSLYTDRIGKRLSVIIGTVASLIGYLLMPILSTGLISAVLITGLTRGFFEFAIVANFPLLSEQVPEQRGKVMTLSAAVGLTGVTLASFTAPMLYTMHGLVGMTVVSAISSAIALVILFSFVREGNH